MHFDDVDTGTDRQREQLALAIALLRALWLHAQMRPDWNSHILMVGSND